MNINLELLTAEERAVWERLDRGRAMESDLRGVLRSLCAARQSAKDTLVDLNAACDASVGVNHAGHIAVAIERLRRAAKGNPAPVVCEWRHCGEAPETVCLLCEAPLCEIHWHDDAEAGVVCLSSCAAVPGAVS